MINRYLGNKQSILTPVLEEIGRHATPGDHVVDAFSGSLSVSLGLKAAGYRVTANDINLFSWVLARAYLTSSTLPPSVAHLIPSEQRSDRLATSQAVLQARSVVDGYRFAAHEDLRVDALSLEALLRYLQDADGSDLPTQYRRSDFFDAYCEQGAKSDFTSSRGRSGRRRFFTAENARRIDVVLGYARWWHREGMIDPHSEAIVLASLMRAVERVSNTQGTYHDFPRDRYDSRALGALTLDLPPLDVMLSGVGGHKAGRAQDSLEFIRTVDRHAVLYLDPPYNFRQYSAYYFMINLIARYIEIDDLDDYFGRLAYVRGQNPDDDFVSSFCKASRFIDDMRTLITRSKCDAVVISYFTGRNHWSRFDSERDDTGLALLSELLREPAFEPGTLAVRTVERRNYASYGGYTARTVDELLISASVRQNGDDGTSGAVRDATQGVVHVGL